jgi:hypothetical protein
MKSVFYMLCLFISAVTWAQTSYIVDKKGVKLYVRDDATEVILIDKRISYVLVGKTWEKYIKFDDLDYALIGSSLLKSFNLNHKKKSKVYFVLGEKQDKQLIGVAVTVTTTSGNLSSSKTFYERLVIDNDQNVIEELKMDDGKSKEDIEMRSKIAPMIKKHFSDCPEVMSKLQKYDDTDEKSFSILGFLLETNYINCK